MVLPDETHTHTYNIPENNHGHTITVMPDFSGNVIVLTLRPPHIDAMIHISDHTIKNAILSYSKPYLL